MKRLLFSLYFSLFTFLCCAQYNVLFNFNGYNGENPFGSLILSGNIIYGMTGGGAIKGDTVGNIFSIHTDGTNFKQLFVFNGTDGEFPGDGSLILSGNMLYGATTGGNITPGNIFCIDTNGNNFKDLFDFNGTNGYFPGGTLTPIGNVLYGLAYEGGKNNQGDIFSIHTDGTGFKDLLDFDGANGSGPQASFTLIGNRLYAMTTYGGTFGGGIIFCIDTDGNGYRDLYDFSGGRNGSQPFGNLTLYGNKFYGMTVQGGSSNYGNIFSVDTDGSGYKDLFDFNGTDGELPFGTLTYALGVLYGTVQHGGVYGAGCIFSIDTNGNNYKKLFDFHGQYGSLPRDLTLSGNVFYGMAADSGTYYQGIIFAFKDTNGGLGVSKVKGESEEVKVYPNPSNGMFTIQVSSQQPITNNYIEIYNVLGQQVYQSNINSDNTQINLSGEPQDVYLYRVLTQPGELVGEGKILIQ